MNQIPICGNCIFWWCKDPQHLKGFCRLDHNDKDIETIYKGCENFIERIPKRGRTQ